MSDLGKRLTEIRKLLGFKSQQAFADYLNVKRSTLASYESNTYPPSTEFLLLLKEKTGANLNWVVSGDGEMFLSEKSLVNKCPTVGHLVTDASASDQGAPESAEKSLVAQTSTALPSENEESGHGAGSKDAVGFLNGNGKGFNALSVQYQRALLEGVNIFQFDRKKGLPTPIKIDEASGESFVFVPVFGQRASAGPGQEETQLLETERSIPVMLSLFGGIHKPVHCGLAKATGDSMIDIGIYDGDLCLFDMDDKKGDGIFMITMYGETRVKRLYYRLAEKKIVIASENQKRYPEPEVISAEVMESGQLIVHGRVFASFHRIL